MQEDPNEQDKKEVPRLEDKASFAAITAPTQTETGLHIRKRELARTSKGFCHLNSLSQI
jgi:hypothetical protein